MALCCTGYIDSTSEGTFICISMQMERTADPSVTPDFLSRLVTPRAPGPRQEIRVRMNDTWVVVIRTITPKGGATLPWSSSPEGTT